MEALWTSTSNLDMPFLSILVLSEQPAFQTLHSNITAECDCLTVSHNCRVSVLLLVQQAHILADNTTVPHLYLLLVAGPAPDGSVALFQELLAKLDTLPEDAQAVSQLLKQGHLPVPHGKVEALKAMTKELVVGSSGKLADFFSNKIQNGGLLDATGKLVFLAAHKANASFTSQSCAANICFC